MPLPETIAVRFTEEDAGYVTVRPVVKQSFRIGELADMVVSVTGKNAPRVQQVFRAGTVVYNGYRYWWDGFLATENEVASILVPFPDDDPARLFDPAEVASVSLEFGGGTQRSLVAITRVEASSKKLFHKESMWEIVLGAAKHSTPRYEKYSHADHADLFRVHFSSEFAPSFKKQMMDAAPRSWRKKLTALPPPAAILFFLQRKDSLRAGASG